MKFGEISESEYNEFEKNHPLGIFLQTVNQYHVLNERNWDAKLVALRNDNNQIIAAAVLGSRKLHIGRLYEVTGGPVMNYNDQAVVKTFADEMAKFCRQHGGLILRWIPNLHQAKFDDHGNVLETMNQAAKNNLELAEFQYNEPQKVENGHYSKVALSYEFIKRLNGLNAATLEKSYSKDAQYSVKKAKEFGVTIRKIPYAELEEFHKYTTATAERRGFKDKPLDYYQKSFKAFKDDDKFLFAELDLKQYVILQENEVKTLADRRQQLVEKSEQHLSKHRAAQARELEDQIQHHKKRIVRANKLITRFGQKPVLAGSMFSVQPQEITYLFSFMNDEFRDFFGPYLIQDYMMKLAVERHIPQYNFYGVAGDFSGQDGVLRFKQSFIGNTYEVLGTYTRVVKPITYRFVRLLKRIIGH
ncbi:peptidoglycan bridge formation glycyltransferase FemA/FemB family protein [Furfurilactobacillus rossiae]|uniref:Uncharacterized protein n=1 Tax=Furfurilactobacillus rossiae DSM 15814 TaxID=1114972 RepID=A0A0R1RJE2_9LACO|nr:peptidoglycan bridge formation glycyltransferase FemA/FemB family protein [Furfurilactobacillus rossiae]KRL54341.1 hypothetical protein FD35_GL002681 [Furfurilactobacillus rossiae DSM 15814]QFR66932.1 peptidoglycan bridge formation glycyltransferase FemA/FemB family protein [Furfurilactobacillus rossiae]QLE62429.1 FemAB protein [Furfurilactobacillus rossiae]